MKYCIPEEYYFRLHHIRPRFKNDIENVLIFMATEIAKIDKKQKNIFAHEVCEAIRKFPGNITKSKKTINNWRTEISALFGFIQTSEEESMSWPGLRAIELANNQDLVHFFKIFLYHFQYPGGHLKPHEVKTIINRGIRFKPAQYILRLLEYAEKLESKRIGISKAEATHCIFNDIRVLKNITSVENIWKLIRRNRDKEVLYDWTGDVIRYAGDILDYMEIANLLVSHGPYFFINRLENTAVQKFIAADEWFTSYDQFIEKRTADLSEIKQLQEEWFYYVNKQREEDFFETDILALISEDTEEYTRLRNKVLEGFVSRLKTPEGIKAKEIGDIGESLIYGHECTRIKIGGREDLLHLIKHIPNHFALGYDIKSVELDATQRLIEVKTTISRREIDFSKFHLTPVEWKSAESHGKRYFVYRLLINKDSRKLFILRDPVGLYKNDKLSMTPRDGADVNFDTVKCGSYEELLAWES